MDGEHVEDERQRPASEDRGPRDQRGPDPAVVDGLDHELLFPDHLVHEDSEPTDAALQDDDEAWPRFWCSLEEGAEGHEAEGGIAETEDLLRAHALNGQGVRTRDLYDGGERHREMLASGAEQQRPG